MTDPASAIQRKVQQLINSQIATLGSGLVLTDLDLYEYRTRAERIQNLSSALDRIGSAKNQFPDFLKGQPNDSVFSAVASIPGRYIGEGVQGFPFDFEEFVRRVSEAA